MEAPAAVQRRLSLGEAKDCSTEREKGSCSRLTFAQTVSHGGLGKAVALAAASALALPREIGSEELVCAEHLDTATADGNKMASRRPAMRE